jgi:MFS family permease
VREADGVTPDENRWSEAQALLDGTPSETAQQRLRRGRRIFLLGLVVALVVGAAAGAGVLAWSGSDTGSASEDQPLWRSIVGLLVMLAGLVVAAPAVLRVIRENPWRDGWRTPLLALRMSQRRHLLKQVLGRMPADPAHLPLARHLAETLVRQTLSPTLALGVLLLAIGQLITSSSWFWAGVVVLLVAGWPLMRRRTRRVQKFLDAHPDRSTA